MGLYGESTQMHSLQFLKGWPCHEAQIHPTQKSLFSVNSSSCEAHFLYLKGVFVIAVMS